MDRTYQNMLAVAKERLEGKDPNKIAQSANFLTTGFTWLVTAVFAFARYKGGAWMNKSLVD